MSAFFFAVAFGEGIAAAVHDPIGADASADQENDHHNCERTIHATSSVMSRKAVYFRAAGPASSNGVASCTPLEDSGCAADSSIKELVLGTWRPRRCRRTAFERVPHLRR